MTEITRQHLEDAARAAGHEVACAEAQWGGREDDGSVYSGLMLRGVQDPWRPHLDDGDAFRLMAGLGLVIGWRPDSVVYSFVPPGWSSTEVTHDGTPADAARAAREAVVLCAAEVGRRMRGER